MWLGSRYNGDNVNKLLPYLDIAQMREAVHVVMNGKGIAENSSDIVCAMKSLQMYTLKKRKCILDPVVWR